MVHQREIVQSKKIATTGYERNTSWSKAVIVEQQSPELRAEIKVIVKFKAKITYRKELKEGGRRS